MNHMDRLSLVLAVPLVEGMVSVYVTARTASNGGAATRAFQEMLRSIPTWPDDVREREAARILREIPELQALIEGALQGADAPPASQFVHDVYKRMARQAFMYPSLFAVATPEFNYVSTLHLVRDDIRIVVGNYVPSWAEESEMASEDDLSQVSVVSDSLGTEAVAPVRSWEYRRPSVRTVSIPRAHMIPAQTDSESVIDNSDIE